MKKLYFVLALILGFVGFTNAQKGPAIQFDNISHNFNKIEEGPEYKHEFQFKNTGDQPLIISNVVSPCGCTTPNWTKEPVMPGKTGIITAVYNSAGRIGSFDKTLTVQTNLGAQGDQYLNIRGEVVEKGAATPIMAEPKKEVVKEEMKPSSTPASGKKAKKIKKAKKAATNTPAPATK